MIWSSCLAPVPPIFILPGPAFFVASMNSLAFLYGVFAFTQRMKLSSASICTGVRSRQLNGTPVASGVVNRLESVMMILCGSPDAPFTSRKPSAPAPPALLIGRIDCFIRPCLRSEEHTSELQSQSNLVCRLLLEKKKKKKTNQKYTETKQYNV